MIDAGPATTTRLGTVVPAHAYREILFLPMRNAFLEESPGPRWTPQRRALESRRAWTTSCLSPLAACLRRLFGEDMRRARQIWTQQA